MPSNRTSIPVRVLGTRPLLSLALVTLGLLGLAAAAPGRALAEPIDVRATISIRSGNWTPLPVDEMKRAAGDAALARLTDAGRLRLQKDGDAAGHLALEIGLIGPAETAKLTMTLDGPGAPTLVSTASISVRRLDHAGIYAAFQHVGEQAADRLVAKLSLIEPGAPAARAPVASDPERRARFDAAQAAKHAGRYAEARREFEAVAASGDAPADSLAAMAEDELRYGLPFYAAQQSLNEMARLGMPGQQAERDAALARAENLFRQIQAENPDRIERVTQAQRALDQISVTRNAMANALLASARARAGVARVALQQFQMMEGRCPDLETARRAMGGMLRGLELEAAEPLKDGGDERRYRFVDSATGARIELDCGDAGVTLGDVTLAGRGRR